MDFSDVFIVLAVSHLVGDFLLQTTFQALEKPGGLCRGRHVARRALLLHMATYAAAFGPAFAWVAIESDVGRAAIVAAIVLGTHVVLDDGRVLQAWGRRVKHADLQQGTFLAIAVDQTAHAVVLLAAAIVAAA